MFALILPFIYVIYSVYIPMLFQSALSLLYKPHPHFKNSGIATPHVGISCLPSGISR